MVMLIAGLAFCVLAALAAVAAVVLPRRAKRRSLDAGGAGTDLRRRALDATDRTLRERGINGKLAEELELAGITRSPAAVTLMIAGAAVVALALGAVIAAVRGGALVWVLPLALAT